MHIFFHITCITHNFSFFYLNISFYLNRCIKIQNLAVILSEESRVYLKEKSTRQLKYACKATRVYTAVVLLIKRSICFNESTVFYDRNSNNSYNSVRVSTEARKRDLLVESIDPLLVPAPSNLETISSLRAVRTRRSCRFCGGAICNAS